MRVALVDTTFATAPTGGSHTFLVDLCRGLHARGWTPTIIGVPGPEMGIRRLLDEVGADVRVHLWRPEQLPEDRAAALSRWIEASRPDAYVISNSTDVGWLALPHLQRSLPTVSIAHNDVEAYYAPLRHYRNYIDCAVGVSLETHRKIMNSAGVPSGRAEYIPYGIRALSEPEAAARFDTRDQGPLRIGFIGRVEHTQKRVLDFIPLVAELVARRVVCELHIIGDGEERETLERALRPSRPPVQVRFHGWKSPAEVRHHLRELDVFLLMSAFEGLPLALLEAIGHGVVPVVSRTGSGNTEVVRHGDNGLVAAVGDVRGFADCLEHLAVDRAALSALRRGAWRTSRIFSVEQMIDRYVACFERLISPAYTRLHRPTAGPYPLMPSCRSRYPNWMRRAAVRLRKVCGSL